jgi:hypothetical protein
LLILFAPLDFGFGAGLLAEIRGQSAKKQIRALTPASFGGVVLPAKFGVRAHKNKFVL